jgi:exosortase D (VPLPA-CTERM-specific)
MNSLRIAVVGILVNSYGPQDAEGFLHMFEGWIIFIACAGVLVAEMALFARFAAGKRFFDVFYPPDISSAFVTRSVPSHRSAPAALAACFVLLCGIGVIGFLVSTRQEIQPERTAFAAFPTRLGQWQGRPSVLGPDVEHGLGLTDYLLSDYARPDGRAVNLYVAYYASQRTGVSPHSPSVCIPGNGWQITGFERTHYKDSNISLPFNRVIISKGPSKQLVYYWFDERGTKVANEYISKLYLLRDAILTNRTDGALVRLTTAIYPAETENDADKRLQEFIQTVFPKLEGYLPPEPGTKIKPAMNQANGKKAS